MTTRRTLLAAAALLAPLPALAQAEITAGDMVITHAWTRAGGANANGAAFMVLRNRGSQPDRLLSAATPLAQRIELHSMIRDGDVMRMRPVNEITIAPGQQVALQPGGLHVMLIGLGEALRQGGQVPLTLRFERAGEVRVMLTVEAAGARAPAHRH
ncbi:MAG TPA: copper chaperone PCu(A)C [Acetobacteraceae bacterium]|nr:copper chaperone PCu(A)C [Acetobacteraceae bacterium]